MSARLENAVRQSRGLTLEQRKNVESLSRTNEFHHEIASLPNVVVRNGTRGAVLAVNVELWGSFTTLERNITRVYYVLVLQRTWCRRSFYRISNVHTLTVYSGE